MVQSSRVGRKAPIRHHPARHQNTQPAAGATTIDLTGQGGSLSLVRFRFTRVASGLNRQRPQEIIHSARMHNDVDPAFIPYSHQRVVDLLVADKTIHLGERCIILAMASASIEVHVSPSSANGA